MTRALVILNVNIEEQRGEQQFSSGLYRHV